MLHAATLQEPEVCAHSPRTAPRRISLAAPGFNLAATLNCGQAFRWHYEDGRWIGVVQNRCVRIRQEGPALLIEAATPQRDWNWLRDYLQLDFDLDPVLDVISRDNHVRAAIRAHRGMRILRQPAWECLASFILSSTKQIVQIRQIIHLLCQRHGEPIQGVDGDEARAFPTAECIAGLTESALRACKMGFRAPNLLATAEQVASGRCDLASLGSLPPDVARAELLQLPGVGEKIADCVLLFGFGFHEAFPIDVWVARALRRYYFKGRNVPLAQLRAFARERWGKNAGYAQQYLFHHLRMIERKASRA